MGKDKTLDEINKLFEAASSCDQEIYAEQRSNVLLIAGEHYSRKSSRFWNRIRDSQNISSEQKIRLTKNHTQKIYKNYVNNIVSQAPGVTPMPQNNKEIQDIKAAELHGAIWRDAKEKYKLKTKTALFASDFVGIGEVFCKLFWDPSKGKLKGYEQSLNDSGEMEEDNSKPIQEGDFVFERIFGFNVGRAPDSLTFDDSPYITVKKMVDVQVLKNMIEDPELASKIEKTSEKSFMVFDLEQGGYGYDSNMALVKELYYRPSSEYPNGYYYIWTGEQKLFDGELPFGIFPIVYGLFDEFPTHPRGRSIIKVARPYQAEVNRSASKMAEHQITLGDDKLLIQQGTKLSTGGSLPGIRGVTYAGIAPSILAGRDGSQYLNYMSSQISEMYVACNMQEDKEEVQGQMDPYSLLYRSIRNKKKFSVYAEKFEAFLVDLCTLYLELARRYLPDSTIVYAVGSNEQINISEFKNTKKLCYQIKVEPMAEDPEGMLGKQLVMNHALQYVGSNLDKEEVGKILRNMPFANVDESFSDLTIDYDSATNMILSLDRGEQPEPSKYDKAAYMIKRLVARQRQGDFKYMKPEVQASYLQLTNAYEQMEAQTQQALQRAEAGYIPNGGYLVTMDFYVPDPNSPGKTMRAKLPYQAVDWLITKLGEQGSTLESWRAMNPQAAVEVGQMVAPAEPQQMQMPQPQMGQGEIR